MQIQINGCKSPSLEELINKKIKKLAKYNDQIEEIKVTLEVTKGEHKASAVVHAGGEFYGEATSDDMYKTIDLLIDKLSKQLNKNREIKQHL